MANPMASTAAANSLDLNWRPRKRLQGWDSYERPVAADLKTSEQALAEAQMLTEVAAEASPVAKYQLFDIRAVSVANMDLKGVAIEIRVRDLLAVRRPGGVSMSQFVIVGGKLLHVGAVGIHNAHL